MLATYYGGRYPPLQLFPIVCIDGGQTRDASSSYVLLVHTNDSRRCQLSITFKSGGNNLFALFLPRKLSSNCMC